MIRVLIAEDQHIIRRALVALISLEGDMEVVAELETGDAILEAVGRRCLMWRFSTSTCRESTG